MPFLTNAKTCNKYNELADKGQPPAAFSLDSTRGESLQQQTINYKDLLLQIITFIIAQVDTSKTPPQAVAGYVVRH
jgi:hypothetical protein